MKHLILPLFIFYSSISFSQNMEYYENFVKHFETSAMELILESDDPIENKQAYAIKAYNNHGPTMGRKGVKILENTIYYDKGNNNKYFLRLDCILKSVDYRGTTFRNVNIEFDVFFTDMKRAHIDGDQIVIAIHPKGRYVIATFENGDTDEAYNKNDLKITIYDDDKREAMLMAINFLIEHPYKID